MRSSRGEWNNIVPLESNRTLDNGINNNATHGQKRQLQNLRKTRYTNNIASGKSTEGKQSYRGPVLKASLQHPTGHVNMMPSSPGTTKASAKFNNQMRDITPQKSINSNHGSGS
jgi:hypothetical protein